MLLGLFLHSTLHFLDPSTMEKALPGATAIPPEPSTGVIHMVIWIHIWRMPLFFVLAGYFTALLLERRGPKAFLQDRALRIFGTLVVFHLIFVVLFDRPLGDVDHLWFLWFLTLFCALAPWVPKWRPFRTNWHPLTLLPLFALAGLIGRDGMWHNIPQPVYELEWRGFVLYGVFFLAGLMLWPDRAILAPLRRLWPLLLLPAAMLVPVIALQVEREAPHIAMQLTIAAASWLWIFGLIGLFQTLVTRPSPWITWLLGLAYPTYVLHLYFAIGFSALAIEAGLGQWATVFVSSTATFLTCWVIHVLLIRWTPLNWLFDGPGKTRLRWPFRPKEKAAP